MRIWPQGDSTGGGYREHGRPRHRLLSLSLSLTAVANLAKILNPGKIFISGRGTAAGAMLFDPMFAIMPDTISDKLESDPEVIVKPWGQTDYARGAGVLVLQEIYKHPVSRMMPLI